MIGRIKFCWWTYRWILCFFILNCLHAFSSDADSLLLRLKLTSDIHMRCELLLKLAAYYSDKDQDSCDVYLKISEKLIDRVDVHKQVEWLLLHGVFHFRRGEMDMAIADLDSARKLSMSHHFIREGVQALLRSSEIYMFIGQNNMQYKLARIALQEAEEHHLKAEEAQSMMLIGEVYRRLHQDSTALNYLRSGAQMAKEVKDYGILLKCYKGIATYYLRNKVADSAYQYLQLALEICKNKIDNKEELTVLLIRMGRVYLIEEQYKIAEKYFVKSVEEGLRTSNMPWIGRGYYWIARTYYNMGDQMKAMAFVNRALSYLLKTDDAILTQITYKLKSDIFEHNKQPDSALFYYKLYYALDDTVEKRVNIEDLNNIKWSYILKYKEEQIRQLDEKRKILEEKQVAEKKAALWLIVAVMVMTVLLIISIALARQRAKLYISRKKLIESEMEREKERAATGERLARMNSERHRIELELKNKELSTLSMQMMNKTKIINHIKEETEAIYNALKKRGETGVEDIVKHLKTLIHTLQSTASIDKEWEQFKLHFEKVHQHFFTKLTDRHPNLSPYDQKICAYLFLGLDTKQMAQLMSISPDSMKKQRYRMRKKMNIPNEQSLADYIRTL